MAKKSSGRLGGPAIRAVDPWLPEVVKPRQLLSDEERAQLATISSIVRFRKGEQIYAAGDPAETMYNVIGGIVKSYRTMPNGGEHIAAFLYPEDLFGLAEEGRYVNATKAVTPVVAYAMPVAAVQKRLSKDATLGLHVIAKLCHELRQAQRHALLLAQRHALVKLAMFLQLLEHLQSAESPGGEIYLPMGRSDIADYVGMSLAAVSRGFRTMMVRHIVKIRDRRHVTVVDRRAFDKLLGS